MKIRKALLIVLTSAVVLLSLLASRLYFENVKLIKALKLSNQLTNNSNAAYKELGECATSTIPCDYNKSSDRLNKLNMESKALQQDLTTTLKSINLQINE